MQPITLGLALLVDAHAATIEVPDDFATAQGAVNGAANGDIILFNTTVAENFTVTNKTLTFRASVFEAGWVGTMTVIGAGSNVTIDGMQLRGGTTETNATLIELGVFCQGATPNAVVITTGTLSVTNSEMTCYANGAVDATDATVTVDNSVFRYNYPFSALDTGRAIHQVGGDLVVTGSTFEFNSGVFDGGAVYAQGVSSDIQTSRFYANSTSLGGGAGLYVASDTVNVDGNDFSNNFNLVWYIPGIIVNDPTDLIGVTDDVAGSAVGIGDGAGVYIEDPPLAAATSVVVHDNLFCGNLADRGAGLYVDDVAGVDVTNNRFAENWSMHEGGGMYVVAHSAWGANQEATITNNTFMLNTAGKIPPPFPTLITEIGAGGGVALNGTIVDFRNNILAKTEFGGGILGVDGDDYTIGDLILMDYNIMYKNCDEECTDDKTTWQNFTGDINQIALPSTNIELDPFPLYFGAGDFNCFPDAFYPTWSSPAVRSGDPALPNKYSAPFSDIGAYGGPNANVLDRDGDEFENIYDCNDEVGSGEGVFPGAPEVCDYLDNDCDGLIDEGYDTNWYPDGDQDGFGDLASVQPLVTCDTPPGHVLNRTDCDDGDATVNPGNPEICDGVDNDCDFVADGGLPFFALWKDLDGDNYGSGEQFNGCESQDAAGNSGYYVIEVAGQDPVLHTTGYVPNSTDCNDFNQNVSPAATEICDGLDNNCNGLVDDAQDGGNRYYTDSDGDGFGTGTGVLACTPPDTTAVTAGGDCDDADPLVSPGVAEVCDGYDNDCDGLVDQNAANAPLLYEDLDNDGYGNPSTARRDCNPGPTFTTDIGGDCDDNDPNIGECGACGCQSAPTPGALGGFGLLLGALLGLRRRKA